MFEVKDPNAHVHVDYFDIEDEAFAFIHGVNLGAHRACVTDAYSVAGYAEELVVDSFLYGIAMGIRHRGRVTAAEFDLNESGGFKVTIHVCKDTDAYVAQDGVE